MAQLQLGVPLFVYPGLVRTPVEAGCHNKFTSKTSRLDLHCKLLINSSCSFQQYITGSMDGAWQTINVLGKYPGTTLLELVKGRNLPGYDIRG